MAVVRRSPLLLVLVAAAAIAGTAAPHALTEGEVSLFPSATAGLIAGLVAMGLRAHPLLLRRLAALAPVAGFLVAEALERGAPELDHAHEPGIADLLVTQLPLVVAAALFAWVLLRAVRSLVRTLPSPKRARLRRDHFPSCRPPGHAVLPRVVVQATGHAQRAPPPSWSFQPTGLSLCGQVY